MQQASRGPPRALVSPLPSPTVSHADSNFSVSRYATHGAQSSISGMAPPLQRIGALPGQPPVPSGYPSELTRSHGTNSEPQRGTESHRIHERTVQQHWEAFRTFLNSGENHIHPRQNKAREKLTRLSETQFQELSTDVYDEVLRRSSRSQADHPSLPPNPAFHPKRNQAREKLASLQTTRFKDLAADVFFEIERRFPNVLNNPSSVRNIDTLSNSSQIPTNHNHIRDNSAASSVMDGRSQGSQQLNVFRQTAVIPMKSTMVEEDEESESGSERKSLKNESERSSLHSSGFMSASTSDRNRSPKAAKREPTEPETSKVGELLEKIQMLEAELKRQSSNSSNSRQLRREMEEALERNDKLEEDLAALRLSVAKRDDSNNQRDNLDTIAQLRKELVEQHQISEDVRREAQGFLQEMRELSERESTIYEQAENLQAQVSSLENEVSQWKEKCVKLRTQLRQVKATSQFFSPNPDFKEGSEGSFIRPDGVIKDVTVTRFQMSIDSLLRAARTNITELTEIMKEVIMTVRAVQQDLDESNSACLRDDRFNKLRQRMSNTTNNLMTACRNHANGGPLSPVSLVDAAASHLASTVIEIVKICKLKATPHTIDEDVDNEEHSSSPKNERPPVQNGTEYRTNMREINTNQDRKHQAGQFQPLELQMQPAAPKPRNINEELRDFLGGQTEGIVAAIQRLLSAIRADAKTLVLQTYMGDIVVIVTKVTSNMREAFKDSRPLAASAGSIVEALESCTSRIREMENAASRSGEQQASKEFKQRLAGIAFDTAKQTKELSIVLQSGAEEEEEIDLT